MASDLKGQESIDTQERLPLHGETFDCEFQYEKWNG